MKPRISMRDIEDSEYRKAKEKLQDAINNILQVREVFAETEAVEYLEIILERMFAFDGYYMAKYV
jgi:hypothetical protein